MAVPKKRTSFSRKKIRKQRWLKKIVNHLEQFPYLSPLNSFYFPFFDSSSEINNNNVQKTINENTTEQNPDQ